MKNSPDAVYLRREIFELSSYIPENHRLKNIFNLLRKKDFSFSFSLEGKERVMDYYYELIRSHYNEKAVDELYIFDVLNDLMFVVLMLENEREEDYSYLTDLIKQIIENYKVNFEINSRDTLISVIEEIK